MAKGFGGRGGMGMGGGINMNMIKQAQKMQENMQKMQAELEAKEYTAQAGGGVVSATVNGKRELLSITIDPEAVDPDDVEMLQDMIVAAVNEAIRACSTDAASSMEKLSYVKGGAYEAEDPQGGDAHHQDRRGGDAVLSAVRPL